MRDDQIIGRFRWRPRCNVVLEKTNAGNVRRKSAFDPLSRQVQHSLARIHAIDFDLRMELKQFGEKSSIPLPDDKRAARYFDFAETSDPGPL